MEKIEVDKALLSVKEVCAYLGIGETKARELLTKTNNNLQYGSGIVYMPTKSSWINGSLITAAIKWRKSGQFIEE